MIFIEFESYSTDTFNKKKIAVTFKEMHSNENIEIETFVAIEMHFPWFIRKLRLNCGTKLDSYIVSKSYKSGMEQIIQFAKII